VSSGSETQCPGCCLSSIAGNDNLLACPRDHVEAVFTMLRRRRVEFTGGLEALSLIALLSGDHPGGADQSTGGASRRPGSAANPLMDDTNRNVLIPLGGNSFSSQIGNLGPP
jgi:hypothetical protein